MNNEGVCKIADFGMSRELKTDDTYDTKVGAFVSRGNTLRN